MINPFPVPDRSSGETKEVIEWLQGKINSQGGLTFHDCLDKVHHFISTSNASMAMIAAYYLVNIMKNNPNISEKDLNETIVEIEEQVSNIDEN